MARYSALDQSLAVGQRIRHMGGKTLFYCEVHRYAQPTHFPVPFSAKDISLKVTAFAVSHSWEKTLGNHNEIVKEQLAHMLFGTIIFVVMATIAVALDLAAGALGNIGVSQFTHSILEKTAHAILVLDLVLFITYMATSSYRLFKEMVK